jgi:4-hydroxy-tetrahydrodipicolinate synthase
MAVFRGVFPPLITTFDEQDRFDEQRMRDHVDFMIEGGSDGLCVGGSTGEFINLTRAEWEQLLVVARDQTAGRVPLLAGGAWLSTAETIDRCRFAEELGYEGLLLISPWYQVHTDREVYAHFKSVSESVSIPIMIYNNPAVSGIRLGVELLTRMAEDGIIQYIKDADPDPYNLSRLRMRLGDKLQIFYGHDNNALGGFAFGATGWVSGTANFDPRRWSTFVHACIDDNDYVRARELWYEILPFIELATVGEGGQRPDWIAIIKRGLELKGRKVGAVRPPMLPLTESVDKKLQKIVSDLEG